MSAKDELNNADVAIIGGGLVGMALALALAQPPLKKRVVIIERQSWQEPPDKGKALALNIASQTILQQLGVWSELPSVQPISEVLVSEQGRWGQLHLPASLLNRQALGYVVPEPHLKKVLWQLTQNNAHIQWCRPAQVKQLTRNSKNWEVLVQDDSKETAWLVEGLVAADGQNSWVRQHLGYECDYKDLREQAIVGSLELYEPHYGRAHERITSQGTLALLPTGQRSYDWVITGTSDQLNNLKQDDVSKDRQCQTIRALMNNRLGQIKSFSQHGVYPLSWMTMPQQADEGIVFLGNAAHSIHPIAGQGLNLSLRDMAALVNYGLSAYHRNEAMFTHFVLQCYQNERKLRQKPVLCLTDSLRNWACSDQKWRACFRSCGLGILDMIPYAKKQIMWHLAGLNDHRRLII